MDRSRVLPDLVERPFADELGVSFNRHGIIEDERKALDACDFANHDDAGAEPVAGYAFRVDEYREPSGGEA